MASVRVHKALSSASQPTLYKFPRIAALIIAYLVCYLLLDKFVSGFRMLPGMIAWYAADAISFALLLEFGIVLLPAVALATLLSSILVYQIDAPLLALVGWSVFVATAYALAAELLRRRFGFDSRLQRQKDVIGLIVAAGGVALILALVAVFGEVAAGALPASQQPIATLGWWISDMIGVLALTPFLLTILLPGVKRFLAGEPGLSPEWRRWLTPNKRTLLKAIAPVIIFYLAFRVQILGPFNQLYLLSVPLMWIALQDGIIGFAFAFAAVNFGTAVSLLLFGLVVANQGDLQLLMLVMGMTGLLTAVVVTERRKTQEELQQSEERFRSLYENSTIGMYRTTPDGQIALTNPALIEMLGYRSFEELAARDLEQEGYEPGYERSQFRMLMESNGLVRGLESAWKRKDGSTVFVRESAKAIRDENGRIRYFEGTVEDISDRKAEEQKVIDMARFPLENPAPVFRIRPNGELLFANETARTVWPEQAWSTGSAVNAPWQALAQEAFASGQRMITDVRAGESIYAFSVVPLKESGYVNFYGRDESEQRRAQSQIQKQLHYLHALRDIDQAITSTFGTASSLDAVLRAVTTHLEVDAACVMLYMPGLGGLEQAAIRGFRSHGLASGILPMGHGYAGRAAVERKTLYVPDLRTTTDNPRLAERIASEDFVSYFAVPLIAKGKVAGVLEVFQRSLLQPGTEWLELLNTLAGQAAVAIDNGSLFENLERSSLELRLAYDATIAGWSRAMELRDRETAGHTERVTEKTMQLARLAGFAEADLVHLRHGALLHDIGKMGVADQILLKPGPLTDEEWLVMRQHPQIAYDMLSPIHYLQRALSIPYCHHEKWDGTGYPRGLIAETIPLEARLFAVVDVWDALTSDRPYRAAWSVEQALNYVRSQAGIHFDPHIVKICLDAGILERPRL